MPCSSERREGIRQRYCSRSARNMPVNGVGAGDGWAPRTAVLDAGLLSLFPPPPAVPTVRTARFIQNQATLQGYRELHPMHAVTGNEWPWPKLPLDGGLAGWLLWSRI